MVELNIDSKPSDSQFSCLLNHRLFFLFFVLFCFVFFNSLFGKGHKLSSPLKDSKGLNYAVGFREYPTLIRLQPRQTITLRLERIVVLINSYSFTLLMRNLRPRGVLCLAEFTASWAEADIRNQAFLLPVQYFIMRLLGICYWIFFFSQTVYKFMVGQKKLMVLWLQSVP